LKNFKFFKFSRCFKYLIFFVFSKFFIYIIVLKPGPARRVNPDPANPGLEQGRVYQKIREVKNSADPATWLTW
jgi:hypothetical protein